MSSEEIRKELLDRIKAAERPAKILLFGSHGRGTARPDSDIDLLVVLDSDQMPQNFREKAENYLRISRLLRDLEKRVPIDLLVYTRPEFEHFVAGKSAFSKKILQEGVELS
jgi:predicted nucleotidyltransferase